MDTPSPQSPNTDVSGQMPRYSRTGIIRSLKEKADAERSRSERIADRMTATFGSIAFLIANCIWFLSWIVLNVELIPGLPPFDPFPFGLLTTIVSLEAIILAIFVLISQNRASKVDQVRGETDLRIDIITEQELTKLLEMVSMLAQKQGIDLSQDQYLQEMLKPTDLNKIERAFTRQIR